jgi:hypothetical protein
MKMGETRCRDREKKLLQRSWEVSDKRDSLEIRVAKTVSCYMLGLCPRSQASRGLMWQFVGPTNRIVLESKVPARPLVQPIFIFYPARQIFSKLCRKRHAFSLAAILQNRDGGIRGPAVSSASNIIGYLTLKNSFPIMLAKCSTILLSITFKTMP